MCAHSSVRKRCSVRDPYWHVHVAALLAQNVTKALRMEEGDVDELKATIEEAQAALASLPPACVDEDGADDDDEEDDDEEDEELS